MKYRLFSLSLFAVAASPALADPVDDLVRAEMEHFKIPGAQLVVVKDGKVLKKASYGTASLEFSVRMRDQHALQIASASKVITGTAAMLLVEEGKIALDDPVSKYFPGAGPTLKVWHLLSFTSGLTGVELTGRNDLNDEVVLASILNSPPKYAPGEKWEYSHAGLNLFGLLVKKVSGLDYPDYVQQKMFAPLGMKNSHFGGTTTFVPNRNPVAYSVQTGKLSTWNWPFESGYGYPGSGLNTSASDLALFFQAIQGGKLLKPESWRKMWDSVTLNDGKPALYGLGWDINEVDGVKEVGHEGGGCSWVRHYPEKNLSVAFLTNLNGSKADRVHRAIAKLFFGV